MSVDIQGRKQLRRLGWRGHRSRVVWRGRRSRAVHGRVAATGGGAHGREKEASGGRQGEGGESIE